MVLNATFNNMSVISWRLVLLAGEIGMSRSRENHRSATSSGVATIDATTHVRAQHKISKTNNVTFWPKIASQPAATHYLDVKSETSDRDVVHYYNAIVSAQRGTGNNRCIDSLWSSQYCNLERGHTEDKCNFMAIVCHVSKHDKILVLPG